MTAGVRREPWFWRSASPTARAMTALLTPAALLYQAGYRLRIAATKPASAPVPVICIGNATLGGAGKTPFAILVADLLREAGVAPMFLTRGYGGALSGPVLVDPEKHSAEDVGDEPLLLARHAPVVVSRDRPAGAALAAQTRAGAIVMDDGFQNPSLAKDLSILLASDSDGATNGALFPAGPYRERFEDAKARAGVVVSVGEDKSGDKSGADFRAWLEPVSAPTPERVIAFAGIGRPEKFFAMLERCGFTLARRIAFPDHHAFSEAELGVLTRTAKRENARLICTEKDYVRLPAPLRAETLTLPVVMAVDDREALKRRLLAAITAKKERPQQR
jgi:tetraacyldisaccharide 4'-kinase